MGLEIQTPELKADTFMGVFRKFLFIIIMVLGSGISSNLRPSHCVIIERLSMTSTADGKDYL